MKDLIIPNKSNEVVNLSEINQYFKGIIIGYNGSKAIGYIQYVSNDDYYTLFTSINDDDFLPNSEDETIAGIINYLIDQKICTSFKVIEFDTSEN